ncbi:MAG: 2-polyprenylphenol 6-hydroxylase [Rickettsiales bacterium]|nr:2-polyprenylphenol 6-hydroxylase [Rickettsiales bacterium]
MIQFLQVLFQTIRIAYQLSKNKILISSGHYNFPFKVKLLGFILCIFFNPLGLLIKPKRSFGERLAAFFQSLGPIYIKFGQTLSTRPDLISEDVANSLKYLQDKLPAFDSKIVRSRIEKQFGKEISVIFSEFDNTPIAAASIAQVHKAKLINGNKVAVKILRPNIYEDYEKDIRFLEFIASILTKFLKGVKRLRPHEVMGIFRQSMRLELNLKSEAAAATTIADNFLNDKNLRIPKIYWQFTSNEILTIEWIDGVSIYDQEAIIKLGHDPRKIAAKIAVIFFNQAYRDGFFHADLHPGNILVCKNGQVAMVDFGIVGILSEKDRLAIAEILYAFLKRDYKLVAQVHHRAGYIPSDTNLDYFAQSCRVVAEPIIGLAIKDISIGNLLSELFKVTEEYGMETQPQLLLLQKTMVVVEGIGQSLDKDINMWQLAEPWIKKWAAKNLSPEAKILRLLKKIIQELKI